MSPMPTLKRFVIQTKEINFTNCQALKPQKNKILLFQLPRRDADDVP